MRLIRFRTAMAEVCTLATATIVDAWDFTVTVIK